MKTKRFLIYVDCINIILLYMIVISAYNLLFQPTSGVWVSTFEYVAIGGLFIYFYLVREYIENLYLYLLANCVAVAAMFFLAPNPHIRIRIVIFTVACFILGVYYWLNDSANSAMEISWGMIVALIGISLGAAYCDYEELIIRTFYFAVAFVVLQSLKNLFNNTYFLLKSGQMTDEMPVQEIFRNTYLTAGLVIVTSVLLMVFVRAERMIHFLRSIAFYVVRGLMYLVIMFYNFIGSLFDYTEEIPLDNNTVDEIEEVGLVGEVWEIVSALIILLVIIVVGFYLIRGFVRFIKEVKRRDRRPHSSKVFVTENEVRERIERDVRNRDTGWFFKRTNSEKIRYIYKKKMLSYIKKGNNIKGTNTPVENADVLLGAGGPDIGNMTALYEKTRYSGQEATAAEVSAMKEFARGV